MGRGEICIRVNLSTGQWIYLYTFFLILEFKTEVKSVYTRDQNKSEICIQNHKNKQGLHSALLHWLSSHFFIPVLWWLAKIWALCKLENARSTYLDKNIQGVKAESGKSLSSKFGRNQCLYWNKRYFSKKPLISALIWHLESDYSLKIVS